MTDTQEELREAIEKNDVERIVCLIEERLGIKLPSKPRPEKWMNDRDHAMKLTSLSPVDIPAASDQMTRIRMEIEDRYKSGVVVELDVPKSATILKLKHLIKEKFGFPVECQTLIINERLTEDGYKLSAYKDTNVFLYLKPFKQSQHLSSSHFSHNMSRGTSSSQNTSLDQSSPDLLQHGSVGSTSGSSQLRAPTDNSILFGTSPPRIHNSSSDITGVPKFYVEEETWACARCTRRNRMDSIACSSCDYPRPRYMKR